MSKKYSEAQSMNFKYKICRLRVPLPLTVWMAQFLQTSTCRNPLPIQVKIREIGFNSFLYF